MILKILKSTIPTDLLGILLACADVIRLLSLKMNFHPFTYTIGAVSTALSDQSQTWNELKRHAQRSKMLSVAWNRSLIPGLDK